MTTLSVLIVDDEPGMRLGAERSLQNYIISQDNFDEKLSFKIITAETGKKALELLKQSEVDILILDYKLPDILGMDILTMLKKENYPLLTIMITAYASLEVAISATKNGAFDFLAKPFTPEELRNVIKKAAEHIYLNRRAKKLEEEKRQVRFQFISVLAHELKSPLSAIENYQFMMKDRTLGNDLSQYEHMIDRSIIRIDGMRKMIVDLLDLTKIESGQKLRELENVHLYDVLVNSIDLIKTFADEKKLTINFECDKNLSLLADKSELDIVFNNLLTNAVKYNKENGQIDFSVEDQKDKVIIYCKDSGIGMTQEECDRLFHEFVRIKNKKTRNIMGSGLGLSILKKIVSFYQGKIEVTSQPDVGTQFKITLMKQV